MVNAQRIAELLSIAGPLEETVSAILQRGPGEWAIRFEDIDLDLDMDEPAGRLVWQCALGTVPADRRLAIYEAFLRYNLLAPETGGVMLALDGDVAVLIVAVAAEGLTPDVLADILRNFAAKARIWREIIVEGLPAAAPEPADPMAFGLRA